MLTTARLLLGFTTGHLTGVQKRAHEAEQEVNFRRIALFASICPEPLSDMLKDPALYLFIAQIGQYSEIAHGSIPTRFVLDNLERLSRPRYPLESYDALIKDEPELLDDFEGTVAQLQGYVAFRPHVGHLVAAISGTSQGAQAIRNLNCWLTPYPDGDGTQVHCGFWEMYGGLRERAIKALRRGFDLYGDRITEIVVTGHSLGGSLSYFLVMDIMKEIRGTDENHEIRDIIGQRPLPKLRMVVFGAPRVGNEALSEYWSRRISDYRDGDEDMFREYSLRINDDGAPTLPPHWLGYRHLTQSPLYLFKGMLYRIPPHHKEYGAFLVDAPDSLTDLANDTSMTHVIGADLHEFSWPLGGHNYYFRDMESLQRRIKWLELSSKEESGWEKRYEAKLEEWEKEYAFVPTDSPS